MTLVNQTAEADRQNMPLRILKTYPMEIILAALVIFLILVAPGFASISNVLNVLRTVSMLGIIAFGMTAVIISGEIDLSVGAGAALAGCIVAWFADRFSDVLGDWGAVTAGFAVALLLGFALGYLTGRFRQWFNVPTFITTLALFAALRGVANLITGGFPLSSFPLGFDFLSALTPSPFQAFAQGIGLYRQHYGQQRRITRHGFRQMTS